MLHSLAVTTVYNAHLEPSLLLLVQPPALHVLLVTILLHLVQPVAVLVHQVISVTLLPR